MFLHQSEVLNEERNMIPHTLIVPFKSSASAIIASIQGYEEVSIQVGMWLESSLRSELLGCDRSILRILISCDNVVLTRGATQRVKWVQNISHLGEETMIRIYQGQKMAKLADSSWFRKFGNCSTLTGKGRISNDSTWCPQMSGPPTQKHTFLGKQ